MPLDLTKLPYGWFSEEDAYRLYAAAANNCPPGAFVEIGTYQGKSANVLAQADPERELWMFDSCADCGVLTAHWPHGHHVLRGVEIKDVEPIGPIALLHIDGDHSYAGVLYDLTTLGASVVVGGRIVLHDWLQPNHDDGDGGAVRRAWEQWPGHDDFRPCFTCREQAAFVRVK